MQASRGLDTIFKFRKSTVLVSEKPYKKAFFVEDGITIKPEGTKPEMKKQGKQLFTKGLAILLASLVLLGGGVLFAGKTGDEAPIAQSKLENAQGAASQQAEQEEVAKQDTPAATQKTAEPQKSAARSTVVSTKAAANDDTCDCGHYPNIIVHGIGQSETFLYENGEKKLDASGNPTAGWPISLDANSAVTTLLFPLLKSLVTQSDKGLSKAIYDLAGKIVGVNATGLDGKTIQDVRVESYPYSFAQYTEEERTFVDDKLPLDTLVNTVGEDHMYYFAYNSFGNNIDIVNELYEMVQLVKAETGHDKVNIMPISLGGTVMNGLMEYYKEEIKDDLNAVVYIVPAFNGTTLVGDLYNGRLNTGDEMLYKELFPALVGDYTGYLLNVAIRLLPKKVVHSVLDSLLEGLYDSLLKGCTNMWALVPQEDYLSARDTLLAGEQFDEIRRQTDIYYNAQLNSKQNILDLQNMGVKVYNIVDYNVPILSLVPSSQTVNADGILDLTSSSMGAVSGYVNTPLPDNYAAKNAVCTNPAHNHISPERIVDASTGILPDYTFYFLDQNHEQTGRNDVIIKLATTLCLAEDYVTVYSMPNFPQFNVGRSSKGLRLWLIPDAEKIDVSTLPAADALELQEALAECYAVLENTIVDADAFKNAEKRLDAIVAKIEGRSISSGTDNALLEKTLKFISDSLYRFLGGKGFSDK